MKSYEKIRIILDCI